MLPQLIKLLFPCICLSLVGLSVGDVLDLGPVESVQIRRVEPFDEGESLILGDTYRCLKSRRYCTAVTMCQTPGVTVGAEHVTFTPHRAGNFTCRKSGVKRNFVVYYRIIAMIGQVRARTLANLTLIAPDGGLEANIENIRVEAKDGGLTVYSLPLYDESDRSFMISVVTKNSSVYEIPLKVWNWKVPCDDLDPWRTRVTATRDLGKSDINSFENQMAAFKCIKEKFSDSGNLIDGACLPEMDQRLPSFPMIFDVSKLRRGSADCYGFSFTHEPTVEKRAYPPAHPCSFPGNVCPDLD